MTTASAPGKIILFGEHAVVYGRPALAVPVTQVHADAEVTDAQQAGIWIDAPEIGMHARRLETLLPEQALRKAVEGVFQALEISNPPDLKILVSSCIPVASGLGSGAAVSVALIRALAAHLGSALGDEQVNSLCYEIEKIHHGTPSGIDNTVITYARPVYFISRAGTGITSSRAGTGITPKEQPIETFQVKTPFTIIIADTGVPAPTRESVSDVRKLWENAPQRWETVFDQVGEIVRQARLAIENGKSQELGPLMDANHALLQQMTVSSPGLDNLVLQARRAGAMGAKLSGGGRGGNMIALVTPGSAEKVAEALLAAGAKHTITTTIQ